MAWSDLLDSIILFLDLFVDGKNKAGQGKGNKEMVVLSIVQA